MTALWDGPAVDALAAAQAKAIDLVLGREEPLVVVDSPPGAGKTGLVEDVLAVAVQLGRRVLVTAPRNNQVFDLIARLHGHWPTVPVQLLHSEDSPPPDDVAAICRAHGLPPVTSAGAVPAGPQVVAATASKLALTGRSIPGTFDVLVVDEAYQLAYRDFAPFAHLGRIKLLVGDPGQLRPIVEPGSDAALARFEAAETKVHHPCPAELRRLHPSVPVVQLPATRRLLPTTVEIVQPAFYPDMPFVSAVAPESRRLLLPVRGIRSPVDEALDRVADGESLIALTLPRTTSEHRAVDRDLADLTAAVVARALERGAAWRSPTGDHTLVPADFGGIDQHVASGAELAAALRRAGVPTSDVHGAGTGVAPPEVWQGLQRPFVVVKHPLSGTAAFDGFSLEAGRLCVMASRHQLGCVVVARAGIGDDLDGYAPDVGRRPFGSDDQAWAGLEANARFWRALETAGRVVPAA